MTDSEPLNVIDDVIQPFWLEEPDLRGRMVRLGPELNRILDSHHYPEAVSHVLAETVTVALLLSAMLKYEGVFTLQTKGDGPISMVVADVMDTGDIRAYASYDKGRLKTALKDVETAKKGSYVTRLLGKGYIAFTVDQGVHTHRYQGIVELKGDTLVDCVQHYFNQSEQIVTGVKLAVAKKNKGWRTGGIMLQRLPEEDDVKTEVRGNALEDDWRRVMILLESVTDKELISDTLGCNDVLFRLFHEEQVRVYEPTLVRHRCRCSREKVAQALRTIPARDLEDSKVKEKIYITCEFCNKSYIFGGDELKEIIKDQ